MVRDTGFEPVTPSVSGRCSTTELTALWVETKLKRALRPAAMIFDVPGAGGVQAGLSLAGEWGSLIGDEHH